VLRNRDADEVVRIEREKGSALAFGHIGPLVKFERLREGIARANPDHGIWNCGQSVALVGGSVRGVWWWCVVVLVVLLVVALVLVLVVCGGCGGNCGGCGGGRFIQYTLNFRTHAHLLA
jgi:hypothetical protein